MPNLRTTHFSKKLQSDPEEPGVMAVIYAIFKYPTLYYSPPPKVETRKNVSVLKGYDS